MKKAVLTLLVINSISLAAGGDTLNYTTAVKTLADGQPFYSSLHWAPLRDTIARVVNGRLGNVNLSSTANIDPTKLDTTKNVSGFVNARFDSTITCDSLSSRSVKGNVIGSGTSSFDSISVTKQVKSAGLNSSGPISGTTITSTSTANLDSLHTTKGATFGSNSGVGKSSLEAWASGYTALQIGGNSALFSNTSESGSASFLTMQNVYIDGVGYKRISTGNVSLTIQSDGNHYWYSDASGTADAAFAPTARMKLDSIGRLGIGNSSPSSRLDVTGGIEADSIQLSGGSWLKSYVTGTFACSLFDNTTFRQTVTAKYVKNGNVVSIIVPAMAVNTLSGGTAKIGTIPTALRPATMDFYIPCQIRNNGSNVGGSVWVASTLNAYWQIFKDMAGNYIDAGSGGPQGLCVTYSVD